MCNGKHTLRAEIETLKNTVTKLEEDKVSRSSVHVPSLEELEGKISQQRAKLVKQDSSILTLEIQLRQLGAYNDELVAQLKGAQMEDSSDSEEGIPRETEQRDPNETATPTLQASISRGVPIALWDLLCEMWIRGHIWLSNILSGIYEVGHILV